MAKLTAAQALKLLDVSKATLYRDMNGGKVSYEIDKKGRKVIDTAELARVYGELKNPETKETVSQNGSKKRHETDETVSLLKEKIVSLEAQIETAKELENELRQDKQELREMLKIEQQKTKLMLEDKRERQKTEDNQPQWEEKLTSILENQTRLLEDKRERKRGFWSRIFG